jgi:D-proline reductase (dithiol) PrdB
MKPLAYIPLVSTVTSDLPPLPIAALGPPTLTPLTRPLPESRIILVTSAGVHLRGAPPFEPVNDMSFRVIRSEEDPARLVPSHPTPVRRPGERDIEVVFPSARLRELVAQRLVGSVTAYHLSFLGTIKKLRELVTSMAPRMVDAARDAGADAALFVPL